MQGALNSIDNVIKWIKLNDTPYWRLFSDTAESRNSYPIMSCFKEPNMDASAKILRDTLSMFNNQYGGTFNILLSKTDNPKDNSGPRANITLGAGANTPSVENGIGNVQSNESIEARIQKEVKQALDIQKKEYEHKAEIENLRAEIQGIKEENQSAWSFEKINGIIETAAGNPIVQLVLAKAFGLSGLPPMMGGIAENRTDDSQSVQGVEDDEKLDRAIEIVDNSGLGSAGDIFYNIAQYIKHNPAQAKEFVNQLKQVQNG